VKHRSQRSAWLALKSVTLSIISATEPTASAAVTARMSAYGPPAKERRSANATGESRSNASSRIDVQLRGRDRAARRSRESLRPKGTHVAKQASFLQVGKLSSDSAEMAAFLARVSKPLGQTVNVGLVTEGKSSDMLDERVFWVSISSRQTRRASSASPKSPSAIARIGILEISQLGTEKLAGALHPATGSLAAGAVTAMSEVDADGYIAASQLGKSSQMCRELDELWVFG
jgi:hypothetical protein